MTSINKAAHRIIQRGQDPSGIGLWIWTLYRGRHDVTLRVIVAYRPCIPSLGGENTAYNQQLRYLDYTKQQRCPRKAMLEDLIKDLQAWTAEGDQVILLGNFNEDVWSEIAQQDLTRLGLREVILEQHKNQTPQHT